ncbi:MAG: hypothetical protein MUF30_01620 [Burkholderiales bacterium]|nr:hypothetical protein [Burkholderiales bacterium]
MSDWLSTAKDLAGTVAPLLIVAGWLVNNRWNNERDERKELRAEIDRLRKALEQIEADALHFHTAERFDAALIAKIHTQVRRFGYEFARLPPPAGGDPGLRRFTELRKAITRTNVDAETFAAQPPDSHIPSTIMANVDTLMQSLHKAAGEGLSEPRRR